MASPVAERAPAGAIDLLDGDLYAGDPDPTYAWLRRHAPVYRDETNRLWGVSRYHDVVARRRDREGPGDVLLLGGLPTQPARRRLDDRQ